MTIRIYGNTHRRIKEAKKKFLFNVSDVCRDAINKELERIEHIV
jgi:hypothetical protein